MGIVSQILVVVLSLYLVLLIGRMIFETVQAFARQWRPSGIVLVLAEATYTATDHLSSSSAVSFPRSGWVRWPLT